MPLGFKGGSGFIGGHKIELDDLYIQSKTTFANIIAISLTMQPIKQSDRILILAVGHAGNTGEEYGQADAFLYDPVNALKPESMNASMISEGRLPIIIEPIEADLKIRCKKPRKIYPLGEKGNRGNPVSFTWQNEAASFNIGAKYKTIFYEIISK